VSRHLLTLFDEAVQQDDPLTGTKEVQNSCDVLSPDPRLKQIPFYVLRKRRRVVASILELVDAGDCQSVQARSLWIMAQRNPCLLVVLLLSFAA
jgi:hypothetical protein